jgi:hypothetical protein
MNWMERFPNAELHRERPAGKLSIKMSTHSDESPLAEQRARSGHTERCTEQVTSRPPEADFTTLRTEACRR